MSKIKTLLKKTAASLTALMFIFYSTLPCFSSTSQQNANIIIMNFDSSTTTASIEETVKVSSPDFFVIHGYVNKGLSNDPLFDGYLQIVCAETPCNQEQNVIFYKNCYNVLRAKKFWLSGTPDRTSMVEGAKSPDSCTYALFENQDSKEYLAVFAASLDENTKVANQQALYLFSKFQCYRDYYPTVLSVKCNDNENTKIFDDDGLSYLLHSHGSLSFYGSSSVIKNASCANILNFHTDKPFMSIDTNAKFIALTFDDGPTRLQGRTDKILKTIEKYNVKATFFVLGSRITDDNPKEQMLLKKARSLGCEIGNHTFNHDSYAKLGNIEDIRSQIKQTDALIQEICGQKYATLLRPPGGIVTDKTDLDRPIINWSVDTLDWSSKQTVKGIINTVKRNAQNGRIVLMHDINTKSPNAIEEIIIYLKNSGYNIVTVSELMEFCDVDMWAGYIYTDANHEKRTTFCN